MLDGLMRAIRGVLDGRRERLDCLVEGGLVPAYQGKAGALLGEKTGDGKPNTPIASCDYGALIYQGLHLAGYCLVAVYTLSAGGRV